MATQEEPKELQSLLELARLLGTSFELDLPIQEEHGDGIVPDDVNLPGYNLFKSVYAQLSPEVIEGLVMLLLGVVAAQGGIPESMEKSI